MKSVVFKAIQNLVNDAIRALGNIPLLFKINGDKDRNRELRGLLAYRLNGDPLQYPKKQPFWAYILPSKGSLESGSEILTSRTQYSNKDNNNRILYVNGILSNKERAQVETDFLSKIFKHKVSCLYNPTRGFLIDFAECILGRTIKVRTSVSTDLYRYIRKTLLTTSDRIVITAHSQGGIIAMNAVDTFVRRLGVKKTEKLLSRVDFILLGSGDSGTNADIRIPNIVSVKNEGDYVANLSDNIKNQNIIELDEEGHHLPTHYVANIIDYIRKNQIDDPLLRKHFNDH